MNYAPPPLKKKSLKSACGPGLALNRRAGELRGCNHMPAAPLTCAAECQAGLVTDLGLVWRLFRRAVEVQVCGDSAGLDGNEIPSDTWERQQLKSAERMLCRKPRDTRSNERHCGEPCLFDHTYFPMSRPHFNIFCN